MNAFASGWNESNSLIALTSALIERLDRDELKAVIAHEAQPYQAQRHSLDHVRGDFKQYHAVSG
ncbi:M48 family metalloprotease [Helicobacter pylori]